MAFLRDSLDVYLWSKEIDKNLNSRFATKTSFAAPNELVGFDLERSGRELDE